MITDLGVCDFQDNEMVMTEIYPGVTTDQVKAACGWPLKIAPQLRTMDMPTERDLTLLRDKLDPQKLYL